MNNMKTVFKGQVNGKTFTNREEMNKYIAELVFRGEDITSMSYNQTTRSCDCGGTPQNDGAKKSWNDFIAELNGRVPKPYTNVISYLVPFVSEELYFNSDSEIENNQKDVVIKLQGRMEFLENHILSAIRTGAYNKIEIDNWLNELRMALARKVDWCRDRIRQINEVTELVSATQFLINHTNVKDIEAYRDMYNEVLGFCSAVVDIIKEEE